MLQLLLVKSEDNKAPLFRLFRKIFENLPDKDTHIENLKKFSDDLPGPFFEDDVSDDEKLEEAHSIVESSLN